MKFLNAHLHFKHILQLPSGSKICMINQERANEYRVWLVNDYGKWISMDSCSTLEEFEEKHGSLKSLWKNILLVNGDSLRHYYKDGLQYIDTAYIVEPTKNFLNCTAQTPKPHLFVDYYIKDEYKKLKEKLPELQNIL